MAVASYRVNGRMESMRGFHPPKRASMTHWYKAATAHIKEAPDWRTVDMGDAVVDEDSIVFMGDGWDLFIARKRNLKS